MGLCSSKSAERLAKERMDQEIDRKNREDHKREQTRLRLLLLGAGESGKSTIFKQIRYLHGAGFLEEERRGQIPSIHSNTIAAMKTLVEMAANFGIHLTATAEAEAIRGVDEEAPLTPEVAALIRRLWEDEGIKQTFTKRSRFQITDSASYFLDRVEDLARPDYLPNKEDILKVRVRTSGVVEEEYIIDGVHFVIIDVGGQRNERKKWIRYFEDVTAVIFVAAINEYDQVLFEDASRNRLVEALDLFDEICNSRWFENTSIILFLNKRDLFEEKIRTVDIRQEIEPGVFLFDDYRGGTSYEAGRDFIVRLFLERNREPEKKEIFFHVTCATDTENVNTVFNACKAIVLKDNLKGSGFME